MGKRELQLPVVLGACVLTLTHTAVLLLTPTAYVECHVMLWITASVLCMMRWRMREDEGVPKNSSWSNTGTRVAVSGHHAAGNFWGSSFLGYFANARPVLGGGIYGNEGRHTLVVCK